MYVLSTWKQARLNWKLLVGYFYLFAGNLENDIRSVVFNFLILLLKFIGWIAKQAIFNSKTTFDPFLLPK